MAETSSTNEGDHYALASASGEPRNAGVFGEGEDFLESVLGFSSNQEMTWDELRELESVRRNLLTKAELPIWRILGHWTGTCLQQLLL